VKKKILAAVLAAAVIGGTLFWAIPALAQSLNPLDHVDINPANITMGVGGVQQFIAQAYDSSNQALSNVNYFWLVTGGGGTINNTTGQFTAGGFPGTYAGTVEVVAVQKTLTAVATATVIVSGSGTLTGTPGVLNHIVVNPANATVAPGATQSFTAQGYDFNNVAIPNLVYGWSLPAGGGTIDGNGVFTAGTSTGTYTVQASSIQTGYATAVSGVATVVVSTTGSAAPNISASTFNISRLTRIFGRYLKGGNFANFLGGQFQVNSPTGPETVALVPGTVQSNPSPASLIIVPNNTATPQTAFTLPSPSVIQPSGATLNPGDQVIVVTVNGQVSAVLKVASTTTGQTPPGFKNRGHDNGQGQQNPPGWSHGKKTGWQQGSNGDKSGHQGD